MNQSVFLDWSECQRTEWRGLVGIIAVLDIVIFDFDIKGME